MTGGRFIFGAMAGVLCAGALSQAASAATATGTARGQVRRPVTLINTGDLNFGNVIRGATAGTVSINAQSGARTRTGGATVIGTGFTPAGFTGTASANRVVSLSLGAASVVLNNGSGGTMTVNTFRISSNGSGQQTLPRNYTMPASATRIFRIGGRLNLAANQADGDYSGTIALTMNYQ